MRCPIELCAMQLCPGLHRARHSNMIHTMQPLQRGLKLDVLRCGPAFVYDPQWVGLMACIYVMWIYSSQFLPVHCIVWKSWESLLHWKTNCNKNCIKVEIVNCQNLWCYQQFCRLASEEEKEKWAENVGSWKNASCIYLVVLVCHALSGNNCLKQMRPEEQLGGIIPAE